MREAIKQVIDEIEEETLNIMVQKARTKDTLANGIYAGRLISFNDVLLKLKEVLRQHDSDNQDQQLPTNAE